MKQGMKVLLATGVLLVSATAPGPGSAQVANHVSARIGLASGGGLDQSSWGLSLGYWDAGVGGHWYRVDPGFFHTGCWGDVHAPSWHDIFWHDPWHDPWLDPWTGCAWYGVGFGWPGYGLGFGWPARRHVRVYAGWWDYPLWSDYGPAGWWDYGYRPRWSHRPRYAIHDVYPQGRGRVGRRSPIFGPRYKVDPRVYVTDNGPERRVSKAVPRDPRTGVLRPDNRRADPPDRSTRRAKPRTGEGAQVRPGTRPRTPPQARPRVRPKAPIRPTARARPGVRTRPTAQARPTARAKPTARARPTVRTRPMPITRRSPSRRPGAVPKARPDPGRRPVPKVRPAPTRRPAPKVRSAPARRPAPKVRPARRPPPKGKPKAKRPPVRRRGG